VTSASDELRVTMEKERRKWRITTTMYGSIYPAARLFLIIASSIVAAQKTLESVVANGATDKALAVSIASGLASWVPVLAVLVTVVTALDTWMKPRDKWRGFMQDRDELEDIIIKLNETLPEDSAARNNLRAEFAALRQRHRERNVF
jgi:hypothetical protein